MNKRCNPILQATLICLLLLCFQNIGAQVDLSLDMTANPPDPSIYGNTAVTLEVTNAGPATASSIQIEFPNPNQTVYTGGNEWSASQGNFSVFSSEIWTVGNLAAGESATLTVNYFMLTDNPVIAYAQVTSAVGNDGDSSPGNGTCCTPNEDDETSFSINGGSSFCEIQAAARNFVCDDNNTPNNGADDTYTIDIFCDIVDGNSCGSTYTIMGQTANYGTTVSLGPIPLFGTTSLLTVTDSNDPGISDPVIIPRHNGTCSDFAENCTDNILPNPGFELTFNNWDLNGSSTNTTASFSGTAALSIQSGVSKAFSQTIAIQAGEEYEVSGYVNEGDGDGEIFFQFLDANGQILSTPAMTTTAVGEWDLYEGTATAPANATQMEVGGITTPATPVLFDQFCVRPSDTGGGNCSISAAMSNIQCHDNNTPNNPNDDEYSFDITVNSNGNCSAVYIWNATGSSQPYGSTITYGPYSIADGAVTLSFADASVPSIIADVTVTPPSPCSNGGGGNDIDLALSLEQTNASPTQWSTYNVIATLTNTSNVAATGVRVSFPKPTGVVYSGGNEFTASQGSFDAFNSEEWNIGSLPAGGSVTLEVNYFLLVPNAPLAYAQVSDANENDADSTPGNGTCCTPNEDDEANTEGGGGGGNDCNLSASTSNIQCSDSSTSNNPNDDTFSFSLIVNNSGNCGSFYTISTGNTTLPGYNYGLTFNFGPFPIANGPVTMVFTDQTDPSASTSVTVNPPLPCSNGGGGGPSCSFTTYYEALNTSNISAGPEWNLTETNSGYKVFNKISEFELDLEGNVLSDDEVLPVPSIYNVELVVDSDNNVTMVFNQSPDLPDGTVVPIDIDYNNPTAVYTNGIAVKTSTGYAFGLGIVDVTQSPIITNRVIQTDNVGENVVISQLTDANFFSGFSALTEGPDGSIFTEWKTSGNFSLFTVPADGSTPWQVRVASDTPSSNWLETEVSLDGNYVYTMKWDNAQTFVVKYNVSTGTPLGIDLSDLKESADPFGFRRTWAVGIEPTTDGGLLVSLNGAELGATDYFVMAKYDASDQLVWKLEVPDADFSVTPIGETTDGGALFAGLGDGQSFFLKTTADGQLSPDCGGGTPQADLQVSNLSIQNSPIDAGQILTYSFDATNAGDAAVPGNFSIKGYISTDANLSNDDIQDGTISTGNFDAGSIAFGVVGASTIPGSLVAGSYYLILVIDADGQVTESNENNNIITQPFTINGGGGGGDPCENIVISTGTGELTISNATAAHVIIKVFAPNWSTVLDCLDNTCDNPQVVSGLSGGTHYVTVKLLDSNWQEICKLEEFVDVSDPLGGNGGHFITVPEFLGRPVRLLGIQPNPVYHGETTAVILSNEEGIFDMDIYDTMGRRVSTHKVLLEKGRNEIRLDIKDFRDGVYTLNMVGENWRHMPVRFVVTRY